MIAIAAMSQNKVIGANGKIPWYSKLDFAWFKEKTMGGTLLMGRKTFESIGKALPGRKTIILSKTFQNGLTWDSILENHSLNDQTFLCGGAEIYKLGLPYCEELFLTRIYKDFEGDTFMPPFEYLFKNVEIIREFEENGMKFNIEHWTK